MNHSSPTNVIFGGEILVIDGNDFLERRFSKFTDLSRFLEGNTEHTTRSLLELQLQLRSRVQEEEKLIR
jgi:hypothetical protein